MQVMYGYIYLMKNYHSLQCLAAKEAQKKKHRIIKKIRFLFLCNSSQQNEKSIFLN